MASKSGKSLRYQFITKLYNMRVKETLGKGIPVGNGFRITNRTLPYHHLLEDKRFVENIGLLEIDALKEATVMYADLKLDQQVRGLSIIDTGLQHIHILVNCLWLVKDNNITTEQAFVHEVNALGESSHSNRVSTFYTSASGQVRDVTYTREEILKAVDYMQMFIKKEEKSEFLTKEEIHLRSSRIARGFFLLQSARSATTLAWKISQYCIVLEALLGSLRTNVRTQLCERASIITGFDYNEILKRCYLIRSNILHGDLLDENLRDIPIQESLSMQLDNIIRKIFVSILDNEELYEIFTEWNKEEFNQWFEKQGCKI